MRKNYFVLAAMALLFACNTDVQKKVLVMGQGEINVREKTVSMNNKSGHAEKEMSINDKGAVALNVEVGDSKQTIQLPEENGYYILNLKSDTIVGSQQLIGRDLTNTKVMSQEDLKLKIDSLENLAVGKNVDAVNNFFIKPNQVQKLSSNINARVYGPFKKIPGTIDAAPDNKEPEIYKFYTTTELRELIQNLKELTF